MNYEQGNVEDNNDDAKVNVGSTVPVDGPESKVEVQSADFADLTNSPSGQPFNPSVFGGIPVELTIELGRAALNLHDAIALSEGSVIELDKIVGESLNLLVNGKTIAKGEVVVSNDKYGLKLTEIVAKIH